MNRMDFFEQVILGSNRMLQESCNVSQDTSKQIVIADTFISAFRYYDGPMVADMLETGLQLRLNREPANRFDPQAVEVYAGDVKLGYLPNKESASIAWLMDTGTWVKARIKGLAQDGFYNLKVNIEVWYEKESFRN